jgi:hypothetical protein
MKKRILMIFYILLALFVGIATVSTTCLADALGDLQASPGAGESNGIPAVPPPTCVDAVKLPNHRKLQNRYKIMVGKISQYKKDRQLLTILPHLLTIEYLYESSFINIRYSAL